jgi:hypothetical protein
MRLYCELPIYFSLTCRDLSHPAARSFSCSSFLSEQCSPHSHCPWSIVSHSTSALARGILNNIYPLQMGPSASMFGRQPRHHHQKDPFVHRGSHPCLDRNRRYYRIAITAHLAVILSFLPFCQQCSPWVWMSDVFIVVNPAWSWNKVLEIEASFASTSAGSCPWIPTWDRIHIRVILYPSPLRYIRDLVRNSTAFVQYDFPVALSPSIEARLSVRITYAPIGLNSIKSQVK